jgi:AraC-like DNA-binding protein/quercetin dioxygenase-like cupin family protein
LNLIWFSAKNGHMKVLPFQVPHVGGEAFRIQVDTEPGFLSRLHQHEEIQITWIQSGEGLMLAGDYVGRFEAGDVFVLGSNLPHMFRNDAWSTGSSSPPPRAVSLLFSPGYMGETFWQLFEMRCIRHFIGKARQGFRINRQDRHRAARYLTRITRADDVRRITLFLSFLNEVAKNFHLEPLGFSVFPPQGGREDKRMNDILEFTFREYHRKITLSEVAAIAHLTPSAFCRYFRNRTRKSYVSFLQEVRIRKACQLLMQPNITIEQVCYAVGFGNISNFNRIFKRITSQTPTTYLTRSLWYSQKKSNPSS